MFRPLRSEEYREAEFRSKKEGCNAPHPETKSRIAEYQKRLEEGRPLWDRDQDEFEEHKNHIRRIKLMMEGKKFSYREAAAKLKISEAQVREIYSILRK